MSSNSKHLREFETLRIDLEKKVLWFRDQPVQLPGKAVEVLCQLVEDPGEVVTKDELLKKVWHDSFVEENVLSQSVHHLRKAFREMNVPQNTIQTIPRRGYRLTANVRSVGEDLVVEHEIVERSFLAEISEDALKAGTLPAIRRRVFLPLGVILPGVLLLAFAVWWYATPASSVGVKPVESIAVLPLKSLNSTERSQTLSLGLTDSLISRLARLNRFSVRPFSAIEKYIESSKDGLTFGRELKTDSVIEGTIQNVDGRIRISLKLLDVRNGAQIWSDTFDETESDILKLQDQVSNRVARALLTRLHPQEEILLAKGPTTNPEAYLLYITGRERWLQRNWKAESIAFYQKAIALDPNFALPYLGIADEYAFTYETKRAADALSKALELDPDLAEAHATRGFLQMFHHWDWKEAESSFQRALELAPNAAKTHHWYGVFLSVQGKFDEALVEMQKALDLDPTALVVMTDIGEIHYYKHDYKRAEAELQKVLEIDPNFLNARLNLVRVRYKNGASYFLEDAAMSVFLLNLRKTEALSSDQPVELRSALERNDEETLKAIIIKNAEAATKGNPSAHLALARYHLVLNEREKALDSLEKALEAKVFVMPFVNVDPIFDSLRSEPRFKEIIRKMNLAL